jgi:hypothetical protein
MFLEIPKRKALTPLGCCASICYNEVPRLSKWLRGWAKHSLKITTGLRPSGLALIQRLCDESMVDVRSPGSGAVKMTPGFAGLLIPEGCRRLLEGWRSPLVDPTKPSVEVQIQRQTYLFIYLFIYLSSTEVNSN